VCVRACVNMCASLYGREATSHRSTWLPCVMSRRVHACGAISSSRLVALCSRARSSAISASRPSSNSRRSALPPAAGTRTAAVVIAAPAAAPEVVLTDAAPVKVPPALLLLLLVPCCTSCTPPSAANSRPAATAASTGVLLLLLLLPICRQAAAGTSNGRGTHRPSAGPVKSASAWSAEPCCPAPLPGTAAASTGIAAPLRCCVRAAASSVLAGGDPSGACQSAEYVFECVFKSVHEICVRVFAGRGTRC
jgi:hypothetical protein